MHKVKFSRNGKTNTFLIPEGWAECKPDQLRRLAPFAGLRSEFRSRPLREQVVQLCLRCKPAFWKRLRLSLDEWHWLQGLCSWVYDEPLQQMPFPSFRLNGVDYYLPQPGYTDTKAIEVAVSNMTYVDFAHPTEPDPTALDRLIFTLCRPDRKDLRKFMKSADWDGDRRELFNEARMMERAAKLGKHVPVDTKAAILNYFAEMNNVFLEMYPELFGKDGDKKKEPRYKDGRGWIMMLKNVAKEGAFGSFESVCQLPVHLLWASVLDDFITTEEQIAEAKKQNDDAYNNQPR